MSDPKDTAGIPEPLPSDALTGPMGDFPLATQYVAAARTLELHGSPTLGQAALGIARSKIGEHEPNRKEHPNTGPIVSWSLEGLTEDAPGPWAEWCGFFACQCPRRALIAAGADAMTLRDWRNNYASGSVSRIWQKHERHGLTVRHDPSKPVPEGVYFVFYANLGPSGEYLYHDDGRPNLRHIGIYERTAGGLLCDVSGNTTPTADRVAEGQHRLDDPHIYGFSWLVYDRPA